MTQENLEYEMAAAEQLAQPDTPPSSQVDALGSTLLAEFAQAELERRQTEERWLKDLRQYKGQYDPDVLSKLGPNRSRAFVRKTRVKIKTIDSRVADLLFPAGSEKNWEIENTPVPSVSTEQRKVVAQQLQQMAMQQAQAQAQAAAQQGAQPQQMPPIQITPEAIDEAVLLLAKEASKKMSKVIEDQLVEARYKDVAIKTVHSGHLYGTGVMKGPLVERKIRTRFVQQGGSWVAKSETYVVPFVDFVPLWRFYPDMSASELDQCRYAYERHQMTKADLVNLSQRKSFNTTRIVSYITANPHGQVTLRYFDNELRVIGERNSTQGNKSGTYEVLERWGWLDGLQLKEAGVEVPAGRLHETFFSNVWLLPNGEIIKAVLQPINGVTWPYHLYYFDKDETSIFAEGIATIMRDDQTMINAATRMMLDNAGITSGPQLEVTPTMLSSVERVDEIYPWKVWLRNGSSPGQPAVRAIEMPANLQNLAGMADRFENNADEITAIPRYMSGENATGGAAGTASGMSMLMGAANIVIKDLITNYDEGITRPFLQALYRWNMQFHKDNSIKGDFDVKARGSASLVQKEVRARQLNEFSALVANPMDAPFIKRDVLLRQRAEVNELSGVVKTEDEVLAEQNNELVQAQQQLQMQTAQLAVAELTKKVEVLTAQAAKAMAEVELIQAKAVSTKVESVYAALQAGGTATMAPMTAPAGDEILRSSGWVDATPDPTIAQLGGPPVQPDGQMVQPPMAPQAPEMAQPDVQDIQAPTGMDGRRQGMETPEIDR
jgi:hypothetical protein